VPIAVAGFNYGQYKKKSIFPDTITHYEISGYYLQDLPGQFATIWGWACPAGTTFQLNLPAKR